MVVTIENPIVSTSLTPIAERILWYLFIFGVIFYLFAILFTAYNFIVSGGNPMRLQIARKIFIYSTIGFLIVASPYLIIRVIFSLMGL